MCIDDFDRGQIDDCGDGWFNEAEFQILGEYNSVNRRTQSSSRLSAEDYLDLLVENYD